jgi:hypothetical protein
LGYILGNQFLELDLVALVPWIMWWSISLSSGWSLTKGEILGHGSIALTERYSHLADHALKLAAQKMPDLTRKPKQEKVVKIK